MVLRYQGYAILHLPILCLILILSKNFNIPMKNSFVINYRSLQLIIATISYITKNNRYKSNWVSMTGIPSKLVVNFVFDCAFVCAE